MTRVGVICKLTIIVVTLIILSLIGHFIVEICHVPVRITITVRSGLTYLGGKLLVNLLLIHLLLLFNHSGLICWIYHLHV